MNSGEYNYVDVIQWWLIRMYSRSDGDLWWREWTFVRVNIQSKIENEMKYQKKKTENK